MTVTDYPDWQTPQAHATQIALTGVPLLRATNNLGTTFGTTLAGGASTQLVPSIAVNQPGYELTVEVSMPASSGTIPFVHIALLWWDSASGLFGNRRDIVMAAGNAPANQQTYYAFGPMHSDMFRVDAINLDPAVTATLNWTVNQTSHVFERDQAYQYSYEGTAPNGFSNPGGVPTTGFVAYSAPTIAANSSSSVLCALYAGDVILDVDNSGSAQAVDAVLLDPAGYATGAANRKIFKTTVAAGAEMSTQLALPFSPVVLKLANNSTVAGAVPVVTITGQQH